MTRHSSSLPLPTLAILSTVARFDQATSSQLRRLHYQGTDEGKEVRSRRHLTRLTKLGKLRRMYGIYHGGEKEYVYFIPGTTAKPDDHTLDILELYVRLVEQLGDTFIYEPEDLGYKKFGLMEVTPDAYLYLSRSKFFFIEVDHDSRPARLRRKMRHYVNVYRQSNEERDGAAFALVVWLVHDAKGLRDVWNVIRAQEEPSLFTAMLFEDAVSRLTKG